MANHKVRIRRGFLPDNWPQGIPAEEFQKALSDELVVTVPPNTEVMHLFFKGHEKVEFITVTITE